MRKLVLLAPTPPPAGGIASWTNRMMNTKLKNNWEIILVDEKVIGGRVIFGDKRGVNIFTEISRCLHIWTGLKRAIHNDDVELVHSCIPATTRSMLREYVCALITKKKKKKFVIHFRCTVPNTANRIVARFLLKKLCDKSDLILSLNSETTTFLRKITNTPVKIIPNFVSNNELIERKQITDHLKNVLYVGGVVETKGIYDLLSVAELFPELIFKCVGKTDPNVEVVAKSRDIKNIVFTGEKCRDAISEELVKADAFLFLTYYDGEGFSNALLEAMAAGLPCIVTDWAANSDMVDDDKGGYVVPIKSPQMAAVALENLKERSTRERQSRYNIEKVRKNYIEEIVATAYVDAYETCIGR